MVADSAGMHDVSVSAAVDAVVGRDRELHSIDGFLDAPRSAPAGLVLEGEPGIGKSTLWHAAVAAARERDLLVLVSRPAEADRLLALMGIADLFDPVLDSVIDRLTAPRRRALEVALLRETRQTGFADDGALVVAVRDVLRLLTEQRPVVVAVDDVQWLDASSTRTLASALRRADVPVRLVVARRAEPSEIERAMPFEELPIGPLDLGSLHTMLSRRLGRPLAHRTLTRIHDVSGGNPIYALELARLVDPDADPLAQLRVPATLAELVRGRLAALPSSAYDALAFAAALGAPRVSLLERVGARPAALDPAIASRVVEREGGVIRFTHPLLSSVLYDDLGPRRLIVHARIAAAVSDPVMRARHLALATEEADAAIAGALDDAAVIEADRGATASTAELAEAALRLTPSEEVADRRRRVLAAARAEHAAGEWTRARKLAADLLAEGDLGAVRAEVLLLLSEFEGLGRAVELLEEALAEATSAAMRAAIQCRLAFSIRLTEGFDAALERARAALRLAEEADDVRLRVEALSLMTFLGLGVGDPEAQTYVERAYEIAAATGDVRLRVSTVFDLAETIRDRDEARTILERAYEEVRDLDELLAAETLRSLAFVELDDGHWHLAAEYAERAFDLNTQYNLEVPWVHMPIAEIATNLGRLDDARSHCARALQLAEEQFGFPTPVHLGTMGIVELRAGDPQAALAWFDKALATTTRLGWRAAMPRWWVPDHVEALLALDRLEDAELLQNGWQLAVQPGDDRTSAHALRCQGLIASARGDLAEAARMLAEAVVLHDRARDTFGRARSLLALGVVRRRQLRKRDAFEAISTALRLFEQLGAATWIEDARAELGALSGRRRTEGLTPAERRVAELVAKGRTNQEVAAELFVRVATVETHLSHVYAKLGVRSRTELSVAYRADSAEIAQTSGKPLIPR